MFVTHALLEFIVGVLKSHVKKIQIGNRVNNLMKRIERNKEREEDERQCQSSLNEKGLDQSNTSVITQQKNFGANVLRRRLNRSEIGASAMNLRKHREKSTGYKVTDLLSAAESSVRRKSCCCFTQKKRTSRERRMNVESLPQCDLFNDLVNDEADIKPLLPK